MLQVLYVARKAKLRVFYALHRRYRPGDYETWKYIAPVQKAAWSRKSFEYGTWGGEIRREFEPQPGEIVAQEHWGSGGFANTDLDLQLKKHGIHQLIVWSTSETGSTTTSSFKFTIVSMRHWGFGRISTTLPGTTSAWAIHASRLRVLNHHRQGNHVGRAGLSSGSVPRR